MSSISDYYIDNKYYIQFLCKSHFTWVGKLNLSTKKTPKNSMAVI